MDASLATGKAPVALEFASRQRRACKRPRKLDLPQQILWLFGTNGSDQLASRVNFIPDIP